MPSRHTANPAKARNWHVLHERQLLWVVLEVERNSRITTTAFSISVSHSEGLRNSTVYVLLSTKALTMRYPGASGRLRAMSLISCDAIEDETSNVKMRS